MKRADDGRLGLRAIAEDYLITIVLSAPPPPPPRGRSDLHLVDI